MSKDTYKYFRIEAREIVEGLTIGALELEKDGASEQAVARMLRLAHTLKGAARVVGQAGIAESAHSLEGVLAPFRDGKASVPRQGIDRILALIDQLDEGVRAVEPEGFRAEEAVAALSRSEEMESVRVGIIDLETLLGGVWEAGGHLVALRMEATALEAAVRGVDRLVQALNLLQHRSANVDAALPIARVLALSEELQGRMRLLNRSMNISLDRATRSMTQVTDTGSTLKQVPVHNVFPALERSVRDASQALGKEIAFVSEGGENRLDANVLMVLRDALLHIVRNAVAHGIESRSERIAKGKPAVGTVSMMAERRGHQILLACRDDGRGIDLIAIRQAAVARGLVTQAQAETMDLKGAIALLLEGGVSTSPTVNQVSGRGVGLDVVREAVRRFGGNVNIESEPDRGTRVELTVPVSLSSIRVLKVQAAGRIAAVPQDALVRILRISDSDISHSPGGSSVSWEGASIPFTFLGAVLGLPERAPGAAASALVIRGGTGQAALGVDRLLESGEVSVKPIPASTGHQPNFLGAFLDDQGRPLLVLDPESIVKSIGGGAFKSEAGSPPPRPPLLIIDDSLTTRMLEKSILESAGYRIETAISAEEALEMARRQRYGIFIVDVEMPGMDGFSFVERTKAEPSLQSIPSILVTSRDSREDRKRGAQAGAYAYIVKSEFDEGRLLKLVRELIG